MINAFKKLALAISYVTCLPCGPESGDQQQDLSGLAKYLPVVGTIIGAALLLLYLACSRFNAANWLIAFVLTVGWIGLTRGIHMDGLMDAADGLLSHRSRPEMLKIMQDSRVGNFGAIAGFLVIIAKIIALATLRPELAIPALLSIPAWARWVEVYAITCFPYAREEGMGKIWHETSSILDLAGAAVVPVLVSTGICIYYGDYILALPAVLTVLCGISFSHRVNEVLGGQTGDTYGASVEISEAAGLILVAILQDYLF